MDVDDGKKSEAASPELLIDDDAPVDPFMDEAEPAPDLKAEVANDVEPEEPPAEGKNEVEGLVLRLKLFIKRRIIILFLFHVITHPVDFSKYIDENRRA